MRDIFDPGINLRVAVALYQDQLRQSGIAPDDARAERLVALLPEEVRRVLARGPVDDGPAGDFDPDGPCRCCAALGILQSWPECRSRRAAVWLSEYHFGVDVHDNKEEMGDGPECFRRCVVIYRAAGWTSEVSPKHPDTREP